MVKGGLELRGCPLLAGSSASAAACLQADPVVACGLLPQMDGVRIGGKHGGNQRTAATKRPFLVNGAVDGDWRMEALPNHDVDLQAPSEWYGEAQQDTRQGRGKAASAGVRR